MSTWKSAGKVRITPMGVWDSTIPYEVLDCVNSADGLTYYIAKQDVPAGTLLTNTTYWAKMVDVTSSLENKVVRTDIVQSNLSSSEKATARDNIDAPNVNKTFVANRSALTDSDNADNIWLPGSYPKPGAVEVTGLPTQNSGMLYVFTYSDNTIYQIYQTGVGNIYYRKVGGTWLNIKDEINNQVSEYTTNAIGEYAYSAKRNANYTEELTWESGTYNVVNGNTLSDSLYIRTTNDISINSISSITIYHALDSVIQDEVNITPTISINAFLYHGNNYVERLTGSIKSVGLKSYYTFNVHDKYGEVRLSFKRNFASYSVTPSTENETPLPTDIRIVLTPTIESRLSGKALIGLGDSLIYGQGLSASQRAYCTWLAILRDKYNMTTYNYGVAGTSIAHHEGEENPAMVLRIDDIITTHTSQNIDYFVIEGGANDLDPNDVTNSTPLGNLSRDNLDNTTFYGALNIIVNKIKAKWERAKILLMTNYDRKSRGTTAVNDETYVNAMIEFAKFRGLPVFDNYHDLGVSIKDGGLSSDPTATGQDKYVAHWFFGKAESQHLTVDAFEWVAPIYARKLESI